MLEWLRTATAAHAVVRWREDIGHDDGDREAVVKLLSEWVQRTGWEMTMGSGWQDGFWKSDRAKRGSRPRIPHSVESIARGHLVFGQIRLAPAVARAVSDRRRRGDAEFLLKLCETLT